MGDFQEGRGAGGTTSAQNLNCLIGVPSPQPAVLPGLCDVERPASSNDSHTTAPIEAVFVLGANEHDQPARDGPNEATDDDAQSAERRIAMLENKLLKAKEQNDFFRRHYVQNTTMPSGHLDRETREISKAVDRVEVSSILHTSTPFAAALSKLWFRRILFFVAATLFLLGGLSTNSAVVAARPCTSVSYFRFTAVELRDGTRPEELPQNFIETAVDSGAIHDYIHNFGPVLHGCLGSPTPLNRTRASITLAFQQPVNAYGWFFITSLLGSPDRDPVRFVVEASADGQQWERVGGSTWSFDYFLGAVYHDGPYGTPSGRGATVEFGRGMAWPLMLVKIVHALYCGVVMVATTLTGAVGKEHLGKWVFTVGFLVDGFIFLVAAAGIAAAGDTTSPMFGIVIYMGLVTVLIAGLLAFCERRFVYIILFMGLSFSVTGMYLFFGIDGDVTALVASGVDGVLLVLFSLFVITHRHLLLKRAAALIQPDIRHYEEEWRSLLAERGNAEAARALKAELAMLTSRLPPGDQLHQTMPGATRHREGHFADILFRLGSVSTSRKASAVSHSVAGLRNEAEMEAGPDSHPTEVGVVEAGPIRSLDQLYAQAHAVHPEMVRKVQGWALRSQALLFAHAQEPSPTGTAGATPGAEVLLLSWRDCAQNTDLQRRVKFAKVKSTDRAIEKLLRSYAGDPSRLVDLCRQTLIFNSLQELRACLQLIVADPDVHIVRVKNRYDPDYPAADKSAGYRDVSINLRIVTSETLQLGAAHHVCELQLLLARFALLKRAEGHKRYVAFRNVRGE